MRLEPVEHPKHVVVVVRRAVIAAIERRPYAAALAVTVLALAAGQALQYAPPPCGAAACVLGLLWAWKAWPALPSEPPRR